MPFTGWLELDQDAVSEPGLHDRPRVERGEVDVAAVGIWDGRACRFRHYRDLSFRFWSCPRAVPAVAGVFQF